MGNSARAKEWSDNYDFDANFDNELDKESDDFGSKSDDNSDDDVPNILWQKRTINSRRLIYCSTWLCR